MTRYQLYSAGKGPVAITKNYPSDCSNPNYLPESDVNNRNITIISRPIDYSYFINEISSKRQPSQLREICNYNNIMYIIF